MRYYVVSDIHGFYTELISVLTEQGFFQDNGPRRLVVCGDLFDRGEEAVKLQDFIAELMEKDEVILVRGNHEDLALRLLEDMFRGYIPAFNFDNGTVGTVCQLTGMSPEESRLDPRKAAEKFSKTPFVSRIIPAMSDYYETENYIFVHGWIPCVATRLNGMYLYSPLPDWRSADKRLWDAARWTNGMEAAHEGVIENGKTIVCGHWHTSFGHANYEGTCGEFSEDGDFSPYYAQGIIAIDACTAFSHRMNCIVVED